ncbi:MAG: AmmeMemoRadiSam system protein B [Desulfamplus sp.]|nr:AmmeMemoRadiSam system protein B [Desulfamplus sp.]
MDIKRAAFAGSWYPASSYQCKEFIDKCLSEKKTISNGRFLGGIIPHAGWFFSGSIACRVIASVALSQNFLLSNTQISSVKRDSTTGKQLDAIFIFGMHMNPKGTPCVMVNGAWQTPFGDLPIHESLATEFSLNLKSTANLDRNKIDRAISIKIDSPSSFPEENTIELQLPFIKYFFPDSAIVPVGVPPCDVAERIGEIAVYSAEKLGLNIAIFGSTDMTHYGDNYGFTPAGSGTKPEDWKKSLDWVKNENDPKAINAICEMNSTDIIFQGLKNRNLCCAGAVAAATSAVKKMGAVKGIPLEYATSYDKNPGASFVGYSGVLFSY